MLYLYFFTIFDKITDTPFFVISSDSISKISFYFHDSQLVYFLLFLVMIYLYKFYNKKLHRGFFFGLCLTAIFVFRFFVEFLKENQVSFEDNMSLNMGQWLSVPFVIIGLYFMFFYDRKSIKK